MPLKVNCACGQVLKVPETRAGSSVRCPVCENRVHIPAAAKPPIEKRPQEPAQQPAAVKSNRTESAGEPPPLPKKTPDPAPPPLAQRTGEKEFKQDSTPPVEPAKLPESPAPVDPPPVASSARDAAAASEPEPAKLPYGGGETIMPPEPALPMRGIEHGADRRQVVYWLALSVGAIAALNLALAIVDGVLDAQLARPAGPANWAYVLLLIGILQLAYAVFLAQLPDWSTLWVASLALLVLSAGYAMLLAVLVLGGGNSGLATALQLDEFGDDRPNLICFIMLSLTSLLSYSLGRTSVRWRQSEQLLANGGR